MNTTGIYNPIRGEFVKQVSSAEKFEISNFSGYGIPLETLKKLHELNADMKIVIVERDTGRYYYSVVNQWLWKGVTTNLGYGPENFLSLQLMSRLPIDEAIVSAEGVLL